MKLTPEQIAQGWKLHDCSSVCPIKDDRTRFEFMQQEGVPSGQTNAAYRFGWLAIRAYRITEAYGADAEPARPNPFPQSYEELVWDDQNWSQTIIVDGKRPEWLRDDDAVCGFGDGVVRWQVKDFGPHELAIRVRRREPKREPWVADLLIRGKSHPVTIDLIDGKPDLSSLKIAGDAL